MNDRPFAAIFGALIACILLFLYTGTVIYMTVAVFRHGGEVAFNPGTVYVVTTVGGLVSAMVIAKLAITKPGDKPALVAMENATATQDWNMTAVTIAFLICWCLSGLLALIVGVMLYPDGNSTLGEVGSTWLGLAVASGYAYFGLNQPDNKGGNNNHEDTVTDVKNSNPSEQ